MPVSAGTAFVDIRGEFAKLGQDVKAGVTKSVGQAEANLAGRFSSFGKNLGRNLLAGVGITFAAAGLIKFIGSSVDAARQAEQSQLRLNQAFKTFPALGNVNIETLRKLNTQMGFKTKFDDDAVASGQAVLAQFKLTGQQIQEITPLLADYAAKTGMDIPSAATALGRAFLGNTRALKTIGINFKATGNTAKDYTTIVGLLRQKVGGFAEAEGKTFSGRLEILKTQFGELKESIGRAVLPVLSTMAAFIVGKVLPGLSSFWNFLVRNFKPVFEGLKGAVLAFLEPFKSLAGPATGGVKSSLSAIAAIAATLVGPLKTVAGILGTTLAGALRLLAPLLSHIGPALAVFGGVFVAGKLAGAIGAVGMKFKGLTGILGEFLIKVHMGGGFTTGLKDALVTLVSKINPAVIVIGALAATLYAVSRSHAAAKQNVKDFADALEQESQGVKDATAQLVINKLEQKGLLESLNKAGVTIAEVIRGIQDGPEAFNALAQSLNVLGGGVTGLSVPLDNTNTRFVAVQKNAEPLISALSDLAIGYEQGSKQASVHAVAEAGVAEAVTQATTATVEMTDAQRKHLEEVSKQNRAVNALQTRYDSLGTAVDHFKKSLDATLGVQLTLEQATSAYDQDLAALAQSLRQNGRSFDLNTEKGRNNAAALRTVITDIQDMISAQVRAGVVAANDSAQKQVLIGRLKDLEARYPALKGKIEAYIGAVRRTPVTQSTQIILNTKTATDRLAEFHRLLKNFPRLAKQELAALSVQPINLKAVASISTTYANLYAQEVRLNIGHAQAGGIHKGLTLVGERGPELVNFTAPAMVTPAAETKQILSSGSTDNWYITVNNPTPEPISESVPKIRRREQLLRSP